jgi:hypothetical protein
MSHENSALLPDNYDKLPREAKKTADSKFDRIYKYFFNSKTTRIDLTEEEQEISQRWERAWLFLCRHRTRKQVADLLMRQYNISRAVAYDDIANAMRLYEDPKEDVKRAKRAIVEDAILKGMDKAWKSGNEELRLKWVAKYIELFELDKADSTNLNSLADKFKPHQIIIVSDTESLQKQARKMQEELAEDVEFTRVINEGEGTED